MAIIQQPGGGFEVLIETLLNKERLEQSQQELKLREKDFKLRQEAAAAEQQRLQDVQRGAQMAAMFMAQQGRGIPGLGEATSQVPQGSLPSFMENVLGFLQGGAQARTADATADVATATTDARITQEEAAARRGSADADVATRTIEPRVQATRAQAERATTEADIAARTADTQVEQAQATLANTQIRNAIQSQVLRGEDSATGARALSAWISAEGDMTWGDIKEAIGYNKETPGIPDDAVFTPAEGARGGINADVAKARSFLGLLTDSNERINQLGRGDIDGDGVPEARPVRMSFLSSLQQASSSGLLDITINAIQDPEQRQLVQANRAFADAYRFSLSGQQSSDAERLSMMLSITETTGDDPQTIAQKRRLRETMINVTRQRAAGTMTAVDAAQTMARLAASSGISEEATAAYQSLLQDVLEDQEAEAQGGVIISNVPGENTFSDVPGIIDSIGGR